MQVQSFGSYIYVETDVIQGSYLTEAKVLFL